MLHRNLITDRWTRMAIDSLFERGELSDWREFARALARDLELARRTLFMCERHSNRSSAALARVLVSHYHPHLINGSCENGILNP
jgi:hypothetical protein